jgi:hypothetical protein
MILTGCQTIEDNHQKPLKLITLTEAYPGEISKVSKVELLDGSTGERIIVNDRKIIQDWLDQIKEVSLIPDENQEQRAGYIFSIALFEGDTKKLGFIPNEINNVYYKTNEEFVEPIRTPF